MKRVLFVAYYFPPVAASGAMRPLGFCRHLHSYGWEASVLTTTPESVYPTHPVDHRLAENIPAAVKVHRAGYQDPLSRLLLLREKARRLVGLRSPVRNVHDDSAGKANSSQRPRSFVKDTILEWTGAFPDPQTSWFSSAVRHGTAQVKHAVPDVVVATGGPWTSFLVGRALAKRFDRPLVVDYRDPWTCNPFYSFTAKFLTRKAQRLERTICSEASRIITNTDELRERLCIEYPEIKHKSLMIPNGFDPETIALLPGQATASKANGAQNYELCHFGSVYGKRTPRVLLQAILELQREIALTPAQLRVRFVGTWESTDQDCNRFAVSLESLGFLRREPPVSHDNCLHQMKGANVLLVVQPESPLQVPGKIYECIAMGRPLLLIGGEGATANLVQRYHLGASCPNSIGGVKRLLRGIVEGTETIPVPDQEQVKRFEYRSLTGELAALLDAVVADQRIRRNLHSVLPEGSVP